ncbi:MAG: 50S ribosomal protein L24 [Candidatus Pacebacteria bacterium RIFCSPHIGHO2_01_FULL_46_16]|nr:MAG: 50S ribosomal protein L24 [Candidatus Pacebacteria bacterium RIFCSPHIGHO2_01_FULL_46_16]OGJ22040.1 MAG: 50S ribosomal protein L24 [Candidatus Pacebacteria bacterium RIFCSPHIGHO2_02_FULL_46_9]OGJ38247.1 MAG: 50S ribosomal protein L24 [Candidatus Pacebacteria bacterium RIFCSPLOWO2_01_FULL_47_12]
MKVFVGDKVQVTSGRDKGMIGAVTRVLPKEQKVIVPGANMYARHIKPRQGQAGEIRKIERPLPMSKIAVLNDKGKRDRIGFMVTKDGQKTRIFKKSGAAAPKTKTAKEKKT